MLIITYVIMHSYYVTTIYSISVHMLANFLPLRKHQVETSGQISYSLCFIVYFVKFELIFFNIVLFRTMLNFGTDHFVQFGTLLLAADDFLYIIRVLLFFFLQKHGPKMLDHEGKEVPGNRGYRYFGAARDLPGVRELFTKKRKWKLFTSLIGEFCKKKKPAPYKWNQILQQAVSKIGMYTFCPNQTVTSLFL